MQLTQFNRGTIPKADLNVIACKLLAEAALPCPKFNQRTRDHLIFPMTSGKPRSRPATPGLRKQKKVTSAWPYSDRRKNNEELQDLLDHCDIGFAAISSEGIITGINTVARRWFGYNSAEMIGQMHITTLLAQDFQEAFTSELAKLQMRGWARHLNGAMRCRDRSSFSAQLHIVAIRDQVGNYLRANIAIMQDNKVARKEQLIRDLGEEYAMEIARRASRPIPPHSPPQLVPLIERRRQPQLDGAPPAAAAPFGVERRRSVLSAMTDGIVVFDAGGRIITCNPTAQRILGFSNAMLAKGNCPSPEWCAIADNGALIAAATHPVQETVRTGNACRDIILPVKRPDGSVKRVSVTTEPLFQPGLPLPQGVAMMISDVTERYVAQSSLELNPSQHQPQS